MIQSSRLAAASNRARRSDPASHRSDRKGENWPMTEPRAARSAPARSHADRRSMLAMSLRTGRGRASRRLPPLEARLKPTGSVVFKNPRSSMTFKVHTQRIDEATFEAVAVAFGMHSA